MAARYCPHCGSPLRQKVRIHLDVPTGQRALGKRAIMDKSVKVETTVYDILLVYCTGCPYEAKRSAEVV